VLVLAAAACGAGIALGNWQARRADEKRALGAERDQAMKSAPIELNSGQVDFSGALHRRVAARGEFVAARTVLLDNKLRGGRPGYEVLTPLRLAGSSRHVLVNRGWIAAGPSRQALPEPTTPAGEVRIEGVALERLPHALQAGAERGGRVRQNLDLGAFATETGLQFEPLVIEQHAGPEDGLLREWSRPDSGAEKNAAYSLQWYSLAALAVVIALALSFRKA